MQSVIIDKSFSSIESIAELLNLDKVGAIPCDTIYGISEQQVRLMGKSFEKIRDGVRISVKDTSEATGLIMNHPELFKDYEITKGKMDDVFLAVTGKRLEGGDAR